ncbi:hypothetical protein ACB092_08G054300 [Castanea dentata]
MATLSLKLLIDNNSNKVVFAEAGKEFVDFLFGCLQVPLGSIMGLLSEHDLVGLGSLSSVYESIENLDPSFFQSKASKDSLLRPKPTFSSNTHTPQLLLDFVPPTPTPSTISYPFGAISQSAFVSQSPFVSPAFAAQPNAPSTEEKETGYVRDVVTYMVMDDLTVKPMSTISSVTFLTNLYVKDVSSLREKMVELDKKKVFELIRASFYSTTVLTDVFIGSKLNFKPQTIQLPRLLPNLSQDLQEDCDNGGLTLENTSKDRQPSVTHSRIFSRSSIMNSLVH